MADAVTEDLHTLACSQLGQRLLQGDTAGLARLGLARNSRLTEQGESLLKLLSQIEPTG